MLASGLFFFFIFLRRDLKSTFKDYAAHRNWRRWVAQKDREKRVKETIESRAIAVKKKSSETLTLRMSMNCLEPTLSAWTRKALSYVSRSLQSLASYCLNGFE